MLLPRRLLAAAAALLLAAAALPAQAALVPAPLAELQARLTALTMHAPGHVGVMVEDLTTGYSTAINASATMPAASTIKIPVMVEVFRQLALGGFDLNRPVTLLAGDRDWGSGDLSDARPGSRYPVAKLLTLMITESDNTATNMLIRLVGRRAINLTMQGLGLNQTYLLDSIRSEGPIRSALRSSAGDMVRLLNAMAHEQLVDEWSSRAMLAILTGQRHNSLLPQPLPAGTMVAHKTGTLHDTLNDVGIVYLAGEPYAIAVMTTDLPSLEAGRHFIHGVSRVAYDALERFSTWREANLGGLPLLLQPVAAGPDLQMWTRAFAGGRRPSALPEDAGLVTDGDPIPL